MWNLDFGDPMWWLYGYARLTVIHRLLSMSAVAVVSPHRVSCLLGMARTKQAARRRHRGFRMISPKGFLPPPKVKTDVDLAYESFFVELEDRLKNHGLFFFRLIYLYIYYILSSQRAWAESSLDNPRVQVAYSPRGILPRKSSTRGDDPGTPM